MSFSRRTETGKIKVSFFADLMYNKGSGTADEKVQRLSDYSAFNFLHPVEFWRKNPCRGTPASIMARLIWNLSYGVCHRTLLRRNYRRSRKYNLWFCKSGFLCIFNHQHLHCPCGGLFCQVRLDEKSFQNNVAQCYGYRSLRCHFLHS